LTESESTDIRLGAERILLTLRRSRRATLGITVFPEGDILVVAPLATSIDVVEHHIRRKSQWILRSRRELDAFRPRTSARRFINGETHRYLGRQLRLAFDEKSREVAIQGAFLNVGTAAARGPNVVKRAIKRWYLARAREKLSERLSSCARRIFPEIDDLPELKVRSLTKRWGSMSADGQRLVLNSRLVEASQTAIDYVVVHELCHISHPHHGPAFFDLLSKKLPDWPQRKARLERELA
jgi:predicted metal-dependent hydrolase